MRCPERLAPGWCAAVHGDVNQYLLDLVDRYACGDRALHVDAQLVGPPQRRQDRRSSMLRVSRSRPGLLQANPHAHSVTTR